MLYDSQSAIDGFFRRSCLEAEDKARCYGLIEALHPGQPISPVSCPGYCSMTLLVGDNTVIQFRPLAYRIDLRVALAARDIFGSLVPDTTYITTTASGLLVYEMRRIDGISLMDLRKSNIPAVDLAEKRARLCIDFASFLSQSWQHGRNESLPLGLVGKSLVSRLKTLASDLPIRFQSRARHLLRNLHWIEALPWVLTHGDIMASNVMVDPSTGALTGIIDWAEAERLPFGICLYGLEEMLGGMTTTAGFQYGPDAEVLRELFWTELTRKLPELEKASQLQAVKLSGELGVLLWYGFAFDDGALDRVVQDGRDVEEILKLEAFLDWDF